MARVNIDDEVHADRRFKRLVKRLGSEDLAIGMLYRFWRIAQDYWADGELMPFDEFEAEQLQPLLEEKFAEKQEGGIYASGATDRFAWYVQRCEAGKKGGRPKKPENDSGKPGGDSGSGNEKPEKPETPSEKPNATVTAPVPVSVSVSAVSPAAAADSDPPAPTTDCLWGHTDLRSFLKGVPLSGQQAWVNMVGTSFLIEPQLHKARAQWINVGSKVPGDTVATFVNRWLNRELEKLDKEKAKQEVPRESAAEKAEASPQVIGGAQKAYEEKLAADLKANPGPELRKVHELVRQVTGKMG